MKQNFEKKKKKEIERNKNCNIRRLFIVYSTVVRC